MLTTILVKLIRFIDLRLFLFFLLFATLFRQHVGTQSVETLTERRGVFDSVIHIDYEVKLVSSEDDCFDGHKCAD